MTILEKTGLRRAAAAGAAMLLGLSLLTAGCGSSKKTSDKAGEAKKDQMLTIGMTNAPGGFNPISTTDYASLYTCRFLFDTLLGQPEANKFTPHLADRIDTKDKKTYTIKLNPKAVWTDGKPITAQDVVFTFNLIANPQVQSTTAKFLNCLAGLTQNGKLESGTTIPGLKAVDDHTVEFTCKQPMDPNMVMNAIGFRINIVPKHVYEKLSPKGIPTAKEVTNPTVFSGPYKFVKYVTNDHVELAANDKYVRGVPKIKRIFLSIMNDTNLVVNLKAGKVQMNAGMGISKIPIKDVDSLKQESKLVVETLPASTSQFMMINNERYNLNFRRAMVYAINRQQIKDQLCKGYADITPTMYTRPSPVFDETVKDFPYDPEKAKAELAKSGFDTGKELVLLVPIGNSIREQSADLIQQDLKTIGVKVKLAKMDFPTLMSHARKGDYDMLLMGTAQAAEPDYTAFFAPGSLSNYAHTNDPALMKMFEEGRTLTDFAARKAVYQKIQHYLAENQFQLLLYNDQNFSIKTKNLVGGVKPFWEGMLDDVQNWHFK